MKDEVSTEWRTSICTAPIVRQVNMHPCCLCCFLPVLMLNGPKQSDLTLVNGGTSVSTLSSGRLAICCTPGLENKWRQQQHWPRTHLTTVRRPGILYLCCTSATVYSRLECPDCSWWNLTTSVEIQWDLGRIVRRVVSSGVLFLPPHTRTPSSVGVGSSRYILLPFLIPPAWAIRLCISSTIFLTLCIFDKCPRGSLEFLYTECLPHGGCRLLGFG